MNFNGSTWTTDSDIDVTLTHSGSTWTFKDGADNVETYTTNAGGTAANLNTIVSRDGYTQTMAYNGSGQLSTVTDSYSRVLTFGYTSGLVTSVTLPEGNIYHYAYNANGSLLKAWSPDDYAATGQPVTYAYAYTKTAVPYAVTSITSPDSTDPFQTWDYDANGRGILAITGPNDLSNANYAAITYDDSTGNRTVTNAYGLVETYSFSILQSVPKVTGISRAATSNTPAMSRSFTYDSNGYLASETDWNGNTTTYVRNSHGLPTSITEASGTSIARTTTIAYDTTWVRKPATITAPGVTTTFTYDTSGNVLTKTMADTSGQSQPSRTWSYTYSTVGNVLTAQNPRGNTTTFTYTAGALTQVKNALNQTTNVTSYTTGGYPKTIVDANSVTRHIAYDGEMRPHTKDVVTSGGTFTNTYTYAFDDIVKQILKPDSTTLNFTTDEAHRYDSIQDGLGTIYGVPLEPLGSPSFIEKGHGGTETFLHTFTYDNLGRRLTDVGSTNSQTTTYTYDNNGNVLTVTDPLSNVTTYTYDALNRRVTIKPPASNITTYTYNVWDKVTSVVDGQGDTWTYVFDGFGDMMSKQGPGQAPSYSQVPTLYAYDKDGNVTQKTDARLIVANYTYDVLDRLLTVAYPASSSENVTNTYDQATGHGFGIGHLTSATDAAGTLSRTYDERGNITADTRVVTGATFTTTYTYDSVGRVNKITYPSGDVHWYNAFNAEDQPTSVLFQSLDYGTGTSVTYEPFGGITSFTAYARAGTTPLNENFTYDTDDQLKTATSIQGSTSFMNWSYLYDDAGNMKESDNHLVAHPENENTFDGNNRLTEYKWDFGAGGHRYQYDNIGNAYSDITLTNNTPGLNNKSHNQPASGLTEMDIADEQGVIPTVVQTVTSDADHRITGISPAIPGTTGTTFVYNNAGRLTQVKNSSGTVIASYLYDEFGHRIVKTVSGSNTLFAYGLNGELLEETDGAGPATGNYLQDYFYIQGRLVALYKYAGTPPGASYSVHTDRMGVPQSVTDESSNVVWNALTNPFGGTRTLTSSGMTLNVRNPGQYYDAETGFIQNWNREYIPQWGRYMEEDPLGQAADENIRAYVSNRPSRYIDPTGMEITFAPQTPRILSTPIFPTLTRIGGTIATIGDLPLDVLGTVFWPNSASDEKAGVCPTYEDLDGKTQEQADQTMRGKGWDSKPSRDGKGTVWTNPDNPSQVVRTSSGYGNSPDISPDHQGPYGVVSNGRGKPFRVPLAPSSN